MLIGDTSKKYLKLVNAKSKMYEYFIPEDQHIFVSRDIDKLFINTIAILGDYCVSIIEDNEDNIEKQKIELIPTATFFEEYINGKFDEELDDYLKLISSAAYYMIQKNGNSMVMLKQMNWHYDVGANGLEYLLFIILTNEYSLNIESLNSYKNYDFICKYILNYNNSLKTGNTELFFELVIKYRRYIYNFGNDRELLLIDIITAITKMKIKNSTVKCLPEYTNISFKEWKDIINNRNFIKELWPSQVKLGKEGIFQGKSGIMQMPTGAGKTKSIEIILRAAFMAKRTNFAVIIAPFRALCREITLDLKNAFIDDGTVFINELSDVLTIDYIQSIGDKKNIIIVTPEKLMYLVKQSPDIISEFGLVIFDEAHLFDDDRRGVTYELLASIIKRNIREGAQKVLISAVVPNADKINEWFNGTDGVTISSNEKISVNKNIAFTENTLNYQGKYSLCFLKKDESYQGDFYVPRVVSTVELNKMGMERNPRYFPDYTSSTQQNRDIAISLSNRLCKNGGNVIFCGRKDSARKVVERIIKISERGYDISNFINTCNKDEVEKLYNQSVDNLGTDNYYSQGIQKGVFSHHRNIPEGMKTAVEYAMRKEYIKTVVCTSTLSQGVNLPIRYLIVPSIYQSGEVIEVRDFHNLVGRAGRAGMYTEGTVLFTEVGVRNQHYKWAYYRRLLNNENSEPCESKILDLANKSSKYGFVIQAYIEGNINKCIEEIEQKIEKDNLESKEEERIRYEIGTLINILRQVENFIMSNMVEDNNDNLKLSDGLIENTYAYFLADENQKKLLIYVFDKLKEKIINNIKDNNKIMTFGKSMLDIEKLLYLEVWINANIEEIIMISDILELAKLIFPVMQSIILTKEFEKINEVDKLSGIYVEWLCGESYYDILEYSKQNNIQIRSRIKYKDLSIYNIIECCDDILGFKSSMVISAMADIIRGLELEDESIINVFENLSRRSRYGVSSIAEVILYEVGFNDRCLVKKISNIIGTEPNDSKRRVLFRIKNCSIQINLLLNSYPSVYRNVFNKICGV